MHQLLHHERERDGERERGMDGGRKIEKRETETAERDGE